MRRGELIWVFSYDVSRARIRRKVAELLEAAGARVQMSVFEVRAPRRNAEALAERIGRIMDPDDSLRAYAVTRRGRAASLAIGGAPMPEEEDFWLL